MLEFCQRVIKGESQEAEEDNRIPFDRELEKIDELRDLMTLMGYVSNLIFDMSN